MAGRMWLIIQSNMKKSRKTGAAFLLFILFTSLLYHTGNQLTGGFQKLYQEKVLETNSADFAATIPYTFYEKYKGEIWDFGQSDKKISDKEISGMEVTDAILLKNADMKCGESDAINGGWTFRNADRTTQLSRLKIVEQLDDMPEDAVYVPYVCKTFFGFGLGDTLKISFGDKQESFTIAAFTEDVLFGSRSYLAFDLPESSFYSLWEKAGADADAVIVLFRVKTDVNEVSNKFSELIAEKGNEVDFYSNSDIEYAKNSRSSNIGIYAAVMNAASVIGMIASIVVIAFHMKNVLDRDAKELGAFKAVGYTGFSLVMTYMVQFVLLGFLGAVSGIIISGLIMPVIIGNIATDIGFVWNMAFSKWTVITTVKEILCILFIIGVITMVLSRGIIRLRPVDAFQERNKIPRCRKRSMTMERMPFPVNLSVSLMMMGYEKIKGILISLTIAVIMCVAGFAVILYARLVWDKDGLLQIVGAEVYSVNIQPVNQSDIKELTEELDRPQVRKVMTAIEPGSSRLLCENEVYASLAVYSDYGALENPSIYEGRYPKHENETAISGNLADALGKEIGDTVKVSQIFQETAKEEEYLIVGLTQGTYTGGMDIYLTMEGLGQIDAGAVWQTIHVYLDEGVDTETFCAALEDEFQDRLSYIGSFDQIFYAQFSPIVNSVTAIVFFIITIMLLIIIIMGYFVTNSILLTRKGDFGIMKALGYTAGQIAAQAVMTFMLYIAAGSILGGGFLYGCANMMISCLFRGMGVHKIAFVFPAVWIALLVLCAELIGAFTAMISALKVRKIVPSSMLRN